MEFSELDGERGLVIVEAMAHGRRESPYPRFDIRRADNFDRLFSLVFVHGGE